MSRSGNTFGGGKRAYRPSLDPLFDSLALGQRQSCETRMAPPHGDLLTARTLYEKWVRRAPAIDLVMTLRRMADEDQGERPASSLRLCQCLHADLYARVGQRADKDYIRIYADAGEEPPEFVWKSASDKCPHSLPHRTRISARERRRRAVPSAHVQGFRHHVVVERDLHESVRQYLDHQRESRYGKPERDLVFAENFGARQLFSMSEAEELYRDANTKYGAENKEYVRSVFRKLLKQGNRRGLSKAPPQDVIDDLRMNFPNAGDAIDQVDRAAALSRLTEDGFFQMPPLLLWGDPGVGKTAFLQALARALNVPFRRFDIGALSMGGQLFGLSLGWSTGRTGDIFNMLTESEFLNPVVLLDELEKAGGNQNAPVVPGLLSLLESETSKTYRDEAIDLSLNASHVIWCAAANDRYLMSRPLQSRFLQVTIFRPEGEAAVRVAGSIYRSLRSANPWGKLFPEEIDRRMALTLANYTPREMSRALSIAFGEAARQGRTYLKADDFPAPAKQKSRMGFL